MELKIGDTLYGKIIDIEPTAKTYGLSEQMASLVNQSFCFKVTKQDKKIAYALYITNSMQLYRMIWDPDSIEIINEGDSKLLHIYKYSLQLHDIKEVKP